MAKRKSGSVGSSFEDFLAEEGLLEAATEKAIKRMLAWQIEQAMARGRLAKIEMSRRMKTSRAQLDRLLDPVTTSVTLHTMHRAAFTVGKRLKIELV